MSNLWNKIKNFFQKEETEEENNSDELIFDREILPDERFAELFTSSGGHFLYCENRDEAISQLNNIFKSEQIGRIICFDEFLQNILKSNQTNFVNYPTASVEFSFLKCEGLIAYNGSIMLSSHNTAGRKIDDLPDGFIIYSSVNQIYNDLSQALSIIKRYKSGSLPSGITSIGGVDSSAINESKMHDKQIYLLLVEEDTI